MQQPQPRRHRRHPTNGALQPALRNPFREQGAEEKKQQCANRKVNRDIAQLQGACAESSFKHVLQGEGHHGQGTAERACVRAESRRAPLVESRAGNLHQFVAAERRYIVEQEVIARVAGVNDCRDAQQEHQQPAGLGVCHNSCQGAGLHRALS